jgi:hypothetical protein
VIKNDVEILKPSAVEELHERHEALGHASHPRSGGEMLARVTKRPISIECRSMLISYKPER